MKFIGVNSERFEIYQLVVHNTALVTDSEEQMCKLINEFVRVRWTKKMIVNVGKSKVIKYSMYGNEGRMNRRVGSELLEEIWRFKSF